MARNLRKKYEVKNIFGTPANHDFKDEFSAELLALKNIRIEKIVSKGNITPGNKWMKQRQDEWVILLEGRAEIEFDDSTVFLGKGDYIFIPRDVRHRVKHTSRRPVCYWLAVHIL
ncbi:MAG: cupin domain-containing protein [Bacteroidetes bacterium]|nr:cupin domain-containing protein [Bacteroidota bacterium]